MEKPFNYIPLNKFVTKATQKHVLIALIHLFNVQRQAYLTSLVRSNYLLQVS